MLRLSRPWRALNRTGLENFTSSVLVCTPVCSGKVTVNLGEDLLAGVVQDSSTIAGSASLESTLRKI